MNNKEKKIGIIAKSFGRKKTSFANHYIAQTTYFEFTRQNAKVFSQLTVPLRLGVEAVYAEKFVDEKLSIFEFCRRAIDWVRENEIEEVILITAGPFAARLFRDLTYLAKENELSLSIEIAEKVFRTDERTWFGVSAIEDWARKVEKCRARENYFLKIPWFLYKRMKI